MALCDVDSRTSVAIRASQKQGEEDIEQQEVIGELREAVSGAKPDTIETEGDGSPLPMMSAMSSHGKETEAKMYNE